MVSCTTRQVCRLIFPSVWGEPPNAWGGLPSPPCSGEQTLPHVAAEAGPDRQ